MGMPSPSLRELFETAAGLVGTERARYLDAQCTPTLRDRIERMLAADAGSAGALPAAPAEAMADALAESTPAPTAPLGSRIGPFELLDTLGEGGSSTVFHASRHVDGVRQDVALKLLRRGVHSGDAQRRYRSELQALSQLRHPGIARLIEGGITDSGGAYIALELVDGVPITEFTRVHRFDARARLALFLDVCDAVEAAHRALIVHRDLKPSNVLVDADGKVKLLDFGIAKLLSADDDTHTQVAAFTPAYASPEQRSGGFVTTATDVYGLGIMLGELMTGERLGEDPPRAPSNSISDGHAEGVLPAPAPVTRRLLRGDLDNIVLKALHPDPLQRYTSAGRLADDVQRLLDGRPVAAHPPSRWYRARKFVSRHRGGVATTLAFVLAILASLAVALSQARVAQREARAAREQASRADATRRFLVGVFDHAEPDANRGKAITARELVAQGERELATTRELSAGVRMDLTVMIAHLYWDLDDPAHAEPLLRQASVAMARTDVPDDVKARTLTSIAQVEVAKQQFDTALDHAQQALAIAARIGADGTDTQSEARRIVAAALHGKDDSKAAEAILREALAHDRETYGERSDAVVDDWIALGSALTELSRFDEATVALQKAVELARNVDGPVHSRTAEALQRLGEVLGYAADYEGSVKADREAAAINEEIFGADHSETLVARGNLYWSLERQGHYAEALQGRLDMLPALQKRAAKTPETIAAAYTSIGQDYAKFGRFDEAEAALREALAIWAKAQGSNDEWNSADPMIGLADALRWHGHYGEAEQVLRKAIAIEQKHEPADSGWLNRDRAKLGDMLRQAGRYDEALTVLTDAANARARAKPDPNLSMLLAQWSEAQLDSGDATTALATAERSVSMARSLFTSNRYALGTPLFARARAELALGRADEAEPLLREALAVRNPPNPPGDPRVLELQVALVNALEALHRDEEARTLRAAIEPPLHASSSPYAKVLQRRLDDHGGIPRAAIR